MGKVAVIGLYGTSALFRLSHLPATGETVGGRGLLFEPGGKGYNQALGALKAGADVFFATALGADAYGFQAEEVFRADGLSHYSCMRIENTTTAFAAIARDGAGQNMVMVDQGACALVTPEMIEGLQEGIAGSEVLLLQSEMPVEAMMRALEIGKRHGLYTILNPAPAKELPAGMLGLCDLVTPNLGEAAAIAGMDENTPPGEIAGRIMEMGAAKVVVTMGGDGSYVQEAGKAGYIQPAFPVDAVDTTGAGDNFNGALAACLLRGLDLRDSILYATASSALSVTRPGVMAAIPTRAEVEAFLRNKELNL